MKHVRVISLDPATLSILPHPGFLSHVDRPCTQLCPGEEDGALRDKVISKEDGREASREEEATGDGRAAQGRHAPVEDEAGGRGKPPRSWDMAELRAEKESHRDTQHTEKQRTERGR